ncbi:MAG: hypothetical protein ABI462_12275 [Ignavibacteria bacterium]
MELTSNPKVKDVLNKYPKSVQKKLLHLRKLVLSAATEIDGLNKLEETVKWCEPRYLTKSGA